MAEDTVEQVTSRPQRTPAERARLDAEQKRARTFDLINAGRLEEALTTSILAVEARLEWLGLVTRNALDRLPQ